MLDIGGWEFLLIAVLGIMIIGPKELPGAVRTVSMLLRRARSLARELQEGLEEVAHDAEIDSLTDDLKGFAQAGSSNLRENIQNAVDHDGTLKEAMDFEPDWTDDDLIGYDATEFADDNPIENPQQKKETELQRGDQDPDLSLIETGNAKPARATGSDTSQTVRKPDESS